MTRGRRREPCRWWPVEPLVTFTGQSRRMIRRWTHVDVYGLLSDRQADRVAIMLHAHPAEIWVDWCDIELVDDVA